MRRIVGGDGLAEKAEVLLLALGLTSVFVIPIVLFLFSMLVGNYLQRRNNEKLEERRMSRQWPTLTNLESDSQGREVQSGGLVQANVVIAPSIFHRWVAKWQQLIGGRLVTLAPVVEYAREEAKQRLREAAAEAGWDAVLNLRMETSTIARGDARNEKSMAATEILCFGTGVRFS
jgi:uncharacterized protein YbjQ (UPF0145 family)